MAQFIYFIPGVSASPSVQQLEEAGIAHAFPPGVPMHVAGDSQGPSGFGALVSAEPQGLAYSPKTQEWVSMGKVSIGYSKRPTPRDLARKDVFVDGHEVPLGDGQKWIVPVIRFANGDTRLPRVLKRKPDGEFGYEVRIEYRNIYRLSNQILQSCMKGEGTSLSAEETMAFAAGVLGVNYRVREIEVSILELIDTENVKEISRAALDVPTLLLLVDELKKKVRIEPSVLGLDCEIGVNE